MKKTITSLLSACLLCTVTQAQTLDATFGNNDGLVINNLTQGVDGIAGMALQNDGKILATGTSNGRFVLVRYNANGTFDSSFGNNGVVQTNFIFGTGWTNAIVQSDNKILVSGTDNYKPFVARYNSDGTIDTNFGNNGVQYIVIQGRDNSTMPGMALSAEGKILLVGKKPGNVSDPTYIYVTRLNPDGSTDNSFGPDGTGLSLLSPSINYADGTALHSNPKGIAFNAQGEIFVQIQFLINSGGNYLSDYGILKYSSSGIWNEEFGVGGIAVANINHTGQILESGFEILADGKIISVARKIYQPLAQTGLLLAKYNSDGTFDTNFGTNGISETMVTYSQNLDIEVLSNGKIVIAGDNQSTFTSILYHPDGQIDTEYGTDGFFIYKFDPGSYDYGRAIVQQPDGKIIIGGSTSHQCANTGLALMRFAAESGTASITDLTVDGPKLFPNPTTGKVFVNFPKEFSEINVKVRNVMGQEIGNYYFKNTNQVDLDIEAESGIYFIQVMEQNSIRAELKVIKK